MPKTGAARGEVASRAGTGMQFGGYSGLTVRGGYKCCCGLAGLQGRLLAELAGDGLN